MNPFASFLVEQPLLERRPVVQLREGNPIREFLAAIFGLYIVRPDSQKASGLLTQSPPYFRQEGTRWFEQFSGKMRMYPPSDLSSLDWLYVLGREMNLVGIKVLGRGAYWTDLYDADLSAAELDGVAFVDCLLDRVGFSDTKLVSSVIRRCRGLSINGFKSTWRNSEMVDSDFSASRFDMALIKNLLVSGCLMEGCNFAGSYLSGVIFERVDLSRAVFVKSTIQGMRLSANLFEGADFSGAVFDDSCQFTSLDQLNHAIWSPETRWPKPYANAIRAISQEIAAGVYRIEPEARSYDRELVAA